MDASKSRSKRHAKGTIVKAGQDASYGFPRTYRIRQKNDFQRVQGGGRRIHSHHFVLLLTESKEASSRLGLVVSKRVDKRAAKRNLLKRRLREVFRLNRQRFPKPIDLVVIARSDAAKLAFREVAGEILRALRGKGIIPA